VEVTVEVIDRPIYLRRLTRDRDWDESLIFTRAALDAYSVSRAVDTRAGNNTLNHQDKNIDALIDRMREAATEEAFRQAGHGLPTVLYGEHDGTEHRLSPLPAGGTPSCDGV
jgi:hypothetical protein